MEISIQKAIDAIIKSYETGGKLLVCGNGGSAADSEHIVGELMKSFMLARKLSETEITSFSQTAPDWQYITSNLQGALPAISLCSHTSLMTAFSNDVAPDMVFAQQIYGYGCAGDIFLGISTSGNSNNVVYGAQTAKTLGLVTIAMTGENGGRLAELCDIAIKAPASETYRIQEYHLPAYHRICAEVERYFFK